jgi:hypothetical protein
MLHAMLCIPSQIAVSEYLVNERVDPVPALLLDRAVADVELGICKKGK